MSAPVIDIETGEGWAPDEQLVDAILAGSPTTMDDLSPHDRAWVVAGLKLRGCTAEQIRERLGCSLRLVRQIASEPGAMMAKLYMVEREAFADTHRMSSSEVTRLARALADAEASAARYKAQLDRVIERLMERDGMPTFGCGCPMTRYNTYVAPKTGKRGCRHHRALAQARYRQRRRQSQPRRVELAACG